MSDQSGSLRSLSVAANLAVENRSIPLDYLQAITVYRDMEISKSWHSDCKVGVGTFRVSQNGWKCTSIEIGHHRVIVASEYDICWFCFPS